MYDWPEVRGATDRYWAAIRDRLRAAGVAAPEGLSRELGLVEGWTHPRLVLGQTCGLPLVRELARRVAVVGALDLGLPGLSAGLVPQRGGGAGRRCARGARRLPRRAAGGQRLRLAVGVGGDPAPCGAACGAGGFFGAVAATGAHAASVERVAAGEADLAAIDLATWRYCLRHRPAAARLRVLLLTDPTPGLPYIAAPGADLAALRAALAGAVAALPAGDRAALGIAGFVAMDAADWAPVAERFAAASALGF